MCYALKYGIWNVTEPRIEAVNELVSGGYAPLVSMVLAGRGVQTPQMAKQLLDCDAALIDPFCMRDMDLAAGRVGLAMARGEKGRRSPFLAIMTWTASPLPACSRILSAPWAAIACPTYPDGWRKAMA